MAGAMYDFDETVRIIREYLKNGLAQKELIKSQKSLDL